ncbi:MAG: hypothetical protein HY329_19460 [Chloroflexi bacterium]|nr:hypothetical protein [Chloroflexota bacterium]
MRRRFHRNYRVRNAGAGLLEQVLGIAAPQHGAERTAAGEAVWVSAYLDSPTYRWYQELHLVVELTVAPGFHVYGRPIPEGYIPLDVTFEPLPGLQVGEPRWPEPHPFRVARLDEDFWAYDGEVRGTLPLTFTADPGAGDQTIRATVRYQACNVNECLLPATIELELPVRETVTIDRPPEPVPQS